jgi:RNase adaptor protein for sRNA GlmZ degradation
LEIQNASNNGEDELTAALASTAAMALLSSMNAFSLEDENRTDINNDQPIVDLKDEPATVNDFYAKSKIPLSQLMAEYGEQDIDFEKTIVAVSPPLEKPALSHVDNTTTEVEDDRHGDSMLAPRGKAPIHVEFISFGYKYGAPSSREGWSYSQPLPPQDCRNLPRAPHHVARLSGLSYQVKRVLLGKYYGQNQTQSDQNNDLDDASAPSGPQEQEDVVNGQQKWDQNDNLIRKEATRLAQDTMQFVEEAIVEGGHGYGMPLEMSIFIGSQYGRHRSVVLGETVAIAFRSLLRKNEQSKLTQPVSVGTRHRDVDRNHKDEEAFGTDLKREAQAAKKKQAREERLLHSKW